MLLVAQGCRRGQDGREDRVDLSIQECQLVLTDPVNLVVRRGTNDSDRLLSMARPDSYRADQEGLVYQPRQECHSPQVHHGVQADQAGIDCSHCNRRCTPHSSPTWAWVRLV